MNASDGVMPRLSTATTPTPGGAAGADVWVAAVGLHALNAAQAQTSAKPRNAKFMPSPPGETAPGSSLYRLRAGLANGQIHHKCDNREASWLTAPPRMTTARSRQPRCRHAPRRPATAACDGGQKQGDADRLRRGAAVVGAGA